MYRILGIALLALSCASVMFAGTSTPEIDASTGAAALGLLAGGVLILRSRKKRQ
jgi:hypothetical protein